MIEPTNETVATPTEFRMGALLGDIRSRLPQTDTEAEQDEYIAQIKEQVEAGLAQARRDAFDLVREVLKPNALPDRWEFLQYCLTGWVECGHTGFLIHKYDSGLNNYSLLFTPGLPEGTERRKATATVIDQGDDELDEAGVERALNEGDEDHPVFEITHETIEKGLAKVRDAIDMPDKGPGNWERDLTSIPHLGQGLRNLIIEADLTNESSQLDIWSYTAIVEIALFGEVRYA